MLRKKAIAEFIQTCENNGWLAQTIVDQLQVVVTNTMIADEDRIPEVKILEEGEVIN